MNRKQTSVITFLSITAFLLAFLISGRVWFRLDLTRNKAYTISEVSRNIFSEISDQVTVTYFISDKLFGANPIPGEIEDFLREYAAQSRGKIRVIRKDPAKEGLSGIAEDLGILPQQVSLAEKNEVVISTVYTGILVEYLDSEAVIPVVFSLDTLEYDLASRIRSLARNTERELGVIVADSYKQWDSEYGLLSRELALAGFRVRLLGMGEEIPAALPALFVLGGAEDLDEYGLYPVDRYIMGGGRVLFAADGIFVDSRGSLETRVMRDRGLLAMLANYGVGVRPALVLDRTALTFSFQTQTQDGTFVRSPLYPEWLGVTEEWGNPEHPVSARFAGLDLYWASPLELFPVPGISAEVLFSSTGEAWLQTENFITDPNRISEFESEEAQTRGTKILGAALSGVFPGAFEGRPPPAGEDIPPGLPPQKKPSRIIVVGDTDFAGRLMQVNRGEGRNLDFLIRAAEWLSADDDILAIRGRERSGGRLDRNSDPVKRDAAMTLSRSLNTFVIPLAVIAAAFVSVRMRKKKTLAGKRRPDAL